MTTHYRRLLVGGVLVGTSALAGWWWSATIERETAVNEPAVDARQRDDPSSARRTALALHAGKPKLDGRELVDQDARLAGRYGEPSEYSISVLLESVQVSRHEVRDYYNRHRDRFGTRSFEVSEPSAEKMLKIEVLLGREEVEAHPR